MDEAWVVGGVDNKICHNLTFLVIMNGRSVAMNVSLTPELEKFVQEKVGSGRYTSASEVVREALRLLEKREERLREREQALKGFQAELDRRIAELDRGEGIPGEQVLAELKMRAAERRRKSA
jgi:antitoxin ParD1/3/4